MRDERGYVFVWVLVIIAAIVAAFSSIEFTIDSRPQDPDMYWVFGISLLVVVLGFLLEMRRDAYSASMVLTVVSFVTAFLTGAVAWFGAESHPLAWTFAILSTATFVSCVVYLFRTQYRRGSLPDILRQRFDRRSILEVDGVQFVVAYGPLEIGGGECVQINVVAQNCWNEPRTLWFGLDVGTRLSLDRAGLLFEREPSVTIPGAAVVAMTIPVVAQPEAKGRFVLHAKPKVEGSGGARVRHSRARTLGRRIPGWLTAALLFVGVIAWGGGVRIRIRVRKEQPLVPPRAVDLEPRTAVVWLPEQWTSSVPT